jgi:hypothetical protein
MSRPCFAVRHRHRYQECCMTCDGDRTPSHMAETVGPVRSDGRETPAHPPRPFSSLSSHASRVAHNPRFAAYDLDRRRRNGAPASDRFFAGHPVNPVFPRKSPHHPGSSYSCVSVRTSPTREAGAWRGYCRPPSPWRTRASSGHQIAFLSVLTWCPPTTERRAASRTAHHYHDVAWLPIWHRGLD